MLKNLLLGFLAFSCSAMCAMADSIEKGDYYIVHDFDGNVLKGDALAEYDATADADYVFTAEEPSGDYVKLRHKASGKYLTASTSNTWSVLLSDAGSGDQYYWKLESVQRFSTKIVSKKNSGKRLGCDYGSKNVYYDKSAGGLNWFSVIPSTGEGFEASRKVARTTAAFKNEYGVMERDVYQVTEDITVENEGDEYLDLHIISGTPFDGGTVNLANEKCWLVVENMYPSGVAGLLGKVKINGKKAVKGTNCRVEIYMHGAVVIPTAGVDPFVAKTANGEFSVKLGKTSDLKTNSNKAESFVLKRGYMATLASGTNGGGYSRVWVADHKDLEVTLPSSLKNRVSSVNVRNWRYASKNGYGKTGDKRGEAKNVGSSWYWNWDASLTSTDDIEYIPIKQHLYWPANSNFDKQGSTAMMLYNEPDHSEQHSDDCGTTISEWTAYSHTGEFNACGLRIGSPSATDLTWIKNYLDNCHNMAQRCDFTCTHGYWTSEWDNNLNTLKGYGRQVWITEWKYGASWTSGSEPTSQDDYAKKILNILDKLEYNEYVERYAYYPFDTGAKNGWMSNLYWDANPSKGLNPVGNLYKNVKQHLGYKASLQPVTNWWAPNMEAPKIEKAALKNGKYQLTIKNEYGDNTKELYICGKVKGGDWKTVYTIDPSAYDSKSHSVTLLPDSLENITSLKAVISSLHSSETKESGEFVIDFSEYATLESLKNMKFDDAPFISDGVATYAKDKKTGMNLSGMQPVEGWTIVENGDARAAGQYEWGSSCVLGGTGFTAPATNSEGTSAGGGLGIVSVWTASSQYIQRVILSAGTYTLKAVVNNVGGTGKIDKNLIGFVCDDGTEFLSSKTTYAVGEWTTDTINFTLDTEVSGKLSLGYVAINAGSGSMPHLFIDYVELVQNEDWSAVEAVKVDENDIITHVYGIDGRERRTMEKGINVVVYSSGKRVKKMLK